MASAEDKLNIATYFIMNSPPGEVREVLHDVGKVIKDKHVLDDKAKLDMLRKYNIKMLTSAPNQSDGTYCLTSEYGLVSDDTFMDPRSGKTLKFDHKKESWTVVGEQKQDANDQQVAIQKAMDEYAEQHYPGNKCVPLVYAAKDGTITICVSVRDTNLTNFWTGGWKAVYSLKDGTMTAAIDVTVHYFEDGNVQLHSSSNQTAKIKAGSPEETASMVAATIKNIENDVHESLESMYADMHLEIFKSFRRFLPSTRQPMNWDAGIHLVNEDLQEARQEF